MKHTAAFRDENSRWLAEADKLPWLSSTQQRWAWHHTWPHLSSWGPMQLFLLRCLFSSFLPPICRIYFLLFLFQKVIVNILFLLQFYLYKILQMVIAMIRSSQQILFVWSNQTYSHHKLFFLFFSLFLFLLFPLQSQLKWQSHHSHLRLKPCLIVCITPDESPHRLYD